MCDTDLGLTSRPNGELGIWVGLNGGSSSTSVDRNDDDGMSASDKGTDIPEAVMSRFLSVLVDMNLKLAIVGGGPSAFYVASRLLKLLPLPDYKNVRVHIFDRLWAPHGLVRYGVAPDHPEVKASTIPGLN